MNNEFKYGMQGLFMAIAFFAFVKIVSFIISLTPQPQSEEVTTNIENPTPSQSSNYNSKGKVLFSQNCASCHAIHKQLTGPALAGVTERVADKKLLYEWIRNSPKVLKSGNEYFNTLYNQFNKTQMTSFSNLTNEDIDAILEYIQQSKMPAAITAIAVCYFPR